MATIAQNINSAKCILDERYGTVFELINPQNSQSKLLGLAYVEVQIGKESPAHYHDKTEEIYYFLKGRGLMIIDDQHLQVNPGDAVYIPVRSIHKIRNLSNEPLCLLSIDAPPYDPDDDYEVGGL